MAGSSRELDVIDRHNSLIVDTISLDLNYFSETFVEKGFIARDVSSDIKGMYGVGNREKASRLLQTALGNLKTVPNKQQWFLKFVAIFSLEAPYRDLADTLMRAYQPDVGDLHDIHTELINVAPKWDGLGLALRLHPDLIETIQSDKSGVVDRLREVLTRWLKREYDTEHHGLPSWTPLVKAVALPTGGANRALAQQLAKAHNGTINT